MNNEETLLRVEKAEEILKNGVGTDKILYLKVLDMLRTDYEELKYKEKAIKVSKLIIETIEKER